MPVKIQSSPIFIPTFKKVDAKGKSLEEKIKEETPIDIWEPDLSDLEEGKKVELNDGIDETIPFQFITGPAGSGKTFTINLRNINNPSYIELGATTGIAAINLSTKTINSILKYFDTKSLEEKYIDG